MKYILAVTCPVCGKTIKDTGYSVDFTNEDGVVLLDMFANTDFECEECGTVVYTLDVESMYKYEVN